MKDADFRVLARFWQSCDETSRSLLRRLMRLASQNTLTSVLAVLDNTSSEFEERFALAATSPDGKVVDLSEALLDTFWEQEEADGRVSGER